MMIRTLSLFAIAALSTPLAYASGGTHWGYTGHTSPEHWGELDPAYALCATGKNQSPVDIAGVIESELPALEIVYETKASEILNNGHTVQVNFAAGGSMSIGEHRFELKQVHFHTPSENHIAGHEYPLEAHFVHADSDGALAVVAVMFEEGAENAALAKLWKEMPMQADERHSLTAAFGAADLLPANRDYYRFNGSLTTPPCSEGVWWQVLKSPLTVSRAQVEKFADAVGGPNDRPIQTLNARPLLK